MTKEKLAEQLNGREYGDEITKEEEKIARDNNLLVIFGYSDDCVEFRGAWDDEVGMGQVKIHSKGVLPNFDDVEEDDVEEYTKNKKNCRILTAFFGESDYTWTYEIDLPHATFDVMEDGNKYCRGIVINVKDFKK